MTTRRSFLATMAAASALPGLSRAGAAWSAPPLPSREFPSRALFLDWLRTAPGLPDGEVVLADGSPYQSDGTAREIPDLPGWRRMADRVSPEDAAGFDPDNVHVALANLAREFAGRDLTLYFRSGDHVARQPTVFSCPNVRVVFGPGARLLVDAAIADGRAALEFGTQAGLEPEGAGARQKVVAPVIEGDRSCRLADTTPFRRGDIVGLVSGGGRNSGEYFFGVARQNGFDRLRKCEMAEVERVDPATGTVWFMAPLLDSYDSAAFDLELRRFDMQGRSILIEDLDAQGPGGGRSHLDTGSGAEVTGPRAVNIWGYRQVTFRGGRIRNFPRFGGLIYNCLSGTVSGMAMDGWAAEDDTNFLADDPTWRSPWFTGLFLCGGTDFAITGNTARNMRRLVDIDRGPWFPRNVVFANNVADNCEYVISGHVGEKIVYANNIGLRCRYGLMTRARESLVSGNQIQCERYGLQAGPIAGSGIIWDRTAANAGTLIFEDNQVEVSDGEYFATYLSFDRLVIRGNTMWGSRHASREGITIQARVMRDLVIEDNLIDLSGTGAQGAGNCIYVGDGDTGRGPVLAQQDGVTIQGNELRGGAQGIRFRGVVGGYGARLQDRSRNIVLGPNSHVDHRLRDIRFEAGAYDGAAIRILPGESFGRREVMPRLSLGSDLRRWTEMPLSDADPVETPEGRLIGRILPPLDAQGRPQEGATLLAGQWYADPQTPGAVVRVLASGTQGRLTDLRGSIAAGETRLRLSGTGGLFVGAWVAIGGAAGGGRTGKGAGGEGGAFTARVVGLSEGQALLDRPAERAIDAGPVAYQPPRLSSG